VIEKTDDTNLETRMDEMTTTIVLPGYFIMLHFWEEMDTKIILGSPPAFRSLAKERISTIRILFSSPPDLQIIFTYSPASYHLLHPTPLQE
jgi:hypothetical protein